MTEKNKNLSQKGISEKFKTWEDKDYKKFLYATMISIYADASMMLFTEDDINHITEMLKSIVYESSGERKSGDFIRCIITNDYQGAMARADSINIKAIPIYGAFICNEMPFNLAEVCK